MSTIFQERIQSENKTSTSTMKALVFRGPNQIAIERVPIPKPGPGEAVIRVTLTTICGTDLHILKGEYSVKPGLIIGHEPVGIIHELGVGINGYKIGERVLVGAITPCGQCNYCLSGDWSQCGGAIGGWKFGNTINGAQAEYLLVPNAQANLAKIPDDLRDEQVVLLADIASTGISAAESAYGRNLCPRANRTLRHGWGQTKGSGPDHRRGIGPGSRSNGQANGCRRSSQFREDGRDCGDQAADGWERRRRGD